MPSVNMPDMGEKKHLAPPQGFTTATTDAERKWLNHAYRVLFFFSYTFNFLKFDQWWHRSLPLYTDRSKHKPFAHRSPPRPHTHPCIKPTEKRKTGWTVSAGRWFQCLFTNQSIIHRQASMRKIILYQHSNAIDCLLAISRKRQLSQFHGLTGKRRMHGVAVTWLSQTLNDIRDRFPYLKFKKQTKKNKKKNCSNLFSPLFHAQLHTNSPTRRMQKKLWK